MDAWINIEKRTKQNIIKNKIRNKLSERADKVIDLYLQTAKYKKPMLLIKYLQTHVLIAYLISSHRSEILPKNYIACISNCFAWVYVFISKLQYWCMNLREHISKSSAIA